MPNDTANNMADTIHQLEEELKDLREENKVLTSECDRLIKEKGELLKKSEQIAEYKRLLKVAVEDFKEINSDILTCKYCKWYSAENDECTFIPDDTPCEKICGWKHEAEALALIGEEGGNNA